MINIAQLKTLVGSSSQQEDVLPPPPQSPDLVLSASPLGTPPSPDLLPPFLGIDDLSPINGGNHPSQIFVVDKSDDPKKMRPITSFGAYDMDDVVSAKHCAEEEPIRIGTLYSAELPEPKKRTSPKKSKSTSSKKRKSKSPKNSSRKSRSRSATPI
jgi:hypothetical protein